MAELSLLKVANVDGRRMIVDARGEPIRLRGVAIAELANERVAWGEM
jgi:hypothetical protein